MFNQVLMDYTTLISAANVLNCRDTFYPPTTVNPYTELLRGQRTPPDSPMWLEVACLAEAVEACVSHEEILLVPVNDRDRVLETGRYRRAGVSLVAEWRAAGAVAEADATEADVATNKDWLAEFANDPTAIDELIVATVELLQHPYYDGLPDVFSHSQTVYKFDGESLWSQLQPMLSMPSVSRKFQRAVRRAGFRPSTRYTSFFYPEDSLAFMIRGLLYNEMAKAYDAAYRPHPARAPIVLGDAVPPTSSTAPFGRAAIRAVTDFRDELVSPVNQRIGMTVFETGIPPILAAVLREARDPSDIPRIAMEMRDTAAAREFRGWTAAHYGMGDGRAILDAERELTELLGKLRKEFGLEKTDFELQLWQLTFKLRTPRWAFRLPHAKRLHLQFVRDLAHACVQVQRLDDELVRVFGSAG